MTIAAVPVASQRGGVDGDHAAGRRGPRARLPGKAARPSRNSTWSAPTRTGSTPRASPASGRDCLANMGIYLFNRNTLVDVLQKTDYRDFGKEVFPASIRTRRVQVHLFDGYWEDIGTINSFYEANLELAGPSRRSIWPSAEAPIYTHARFLPPVAHRRAPRSAAAWSPTAAMIEDGAVIENSIIGLRCLIGRNVMIRNSILMGNDYLRSRRTRSPPATARPVRRWASATARTSKGRSSTRTAASAATCGSPTNSGVEITEETPYGMIRDGIVVIPKAATLPDGFSM